MDHWIKYFLSKKGDKNSNPHNLYECQIGIVASLSSQDLEIRGKATQKMLLGQTNQNREG